MDFSKKSLVKKKNVDLVRSFSVSLRISVLDLSLLNLNCSVNISLMLFDLPLVVVISLLTSNTTPLMQIYCICLNKLSLWHMMKNINVCLNWLFLLRTSKYNPNSNQFETLCGTLKQYNDLQIVFNQLNTLQMFVFSPQIFNFEFDAATRSETGSCFALCSITFPFNNSQ